MGQVVQSPNILVIYDFADMAGEYQAMVEITGHNDYDGYPHGSHGIPAEIYFIFECDDARDSDDPSAALANDLRSCGYIVDEDCSTNPVGAVVHIVNDAVNGVDDYIMYSNGDGTFIYDDGLFDIDYAMSSYEELPITFHHDSWWISECC